MKGKRERARHRRRDRVTDHYCRHLLLAAGFMYTYIYARAHIYIYIYIYILPVPARQSRRTGGLLYARARALGASCAQSSRERACSTSTSNGGGSAKCGKGSCSRSTIVPYLVITAVIAPEVVAVTLYHGDENCRAFSDADDGNWSGSRKQG